ncbi:MAG: ADP-ribosylglycohydrolase family protein [Pseudomonadota bacterium]
MADAAAAIWGAYVGDAASLGFHWLYDPDRLRALVGTSAAFRPPNPADFEGARGIFVHHSKMNGDLSHYGMQLQVMHRALLDAGDYDRGAYQAAFAAAFGPGGSWRGYIDKATKGTLAGIAAERQPSGADDDQLPAISKLPALMVALRGRADAADVAMDAVEVTSANDTARAWAPAAIAALARVLDGGSLHDGLMAGIAASSGEVALALRQAMAAAERDPVEFAGEVGRACPLPQAMPVIYQVLARAHDYPQAIEETIRAAGDNCGRAVFVGAMAGAAFGRTAIPLAWSLRLRGGAALWEDCQTLAS